MKIELKDFEENNFAKLSTCSPSCVPNNRNSICWFNDNADAHFHSMPKPCSKMYASHSRCALDNVRTKKKAKYQPALSSDRIRTPRYASLKQKAQKEMTHQAYVQLQLHELLR